MVRLQADEIRPADLLEAVASPAAGAVALFLGSVRATNQGRRVLRLEYQAYEEMALAEMGRIEQQALRRFAASAVALVHRTGTLDPGQLSVAVAVATEHRAAAFDACRFVIDTLKHTVPIWKKEFFEGGAVWIEGPRH